MKWEDVPESWGIRCGDDGNKHYIDEKGVRRYISDDAPTAEECRPCGACGHYPTENGEDFCFHHLGNVLNACCGHGTSDGYIQFDNGVTVRGKFRIEYDKDKLDDETLDFTDATFSRTEDRRKLNKWQTYLAYLDLFAFHYREYENCGKSPMSWDQWQAQDLELREIKW